MSDLIQMSTAEIVTNIGELHVIGTKEGRGGIETATGIIKAYDHRTGIVTIAVDDRPYSFQRHYPEVAFLRHQIRKTA